MVTSISTCIAPERRRGDPARRERPALLFRDWFRARPEAIPAYVAFESTLADVLADTGTCTEVEDPAVSPAPCGPIAAANMAWVLRSARATTRSRGRAAPSPRGAGTAELALRWLVSFAPCRIRGPAVDEGGLHGSVKLSRRSNR